MALNLATRLELQRGLAMLDSGQFDQARPILSDVASNHPKAAPARLFHGIACWDCHDLTAAEAEFQNAHAIEPANTLVTSHLALAKAANGDWCGAGRLWKIAGHHTNPRYRVRATEWMEEQFLRANGWPDRLPPIAASSATTPQGDAPEQADGPQNHHGDWLAGPYAPDAPPPPELLDPTPKRLGFLRRSTLERRVSLHFRRARFDAIIRDIPPLLADPRCDLVTLWVAATAAELTGHPAVADALCRRVQPADQWPDALRAIHARALYRLGHHHHAAQHIAQITIRGPEDYGMHWVLGGLALAQNDRPLARKMFHRAHTAYMVDTIENQWWSLEQALQRRYREAQCP